MQITLNKVFLAMYYEKVNNGLTQHTNLILRFEGLLVREILRIFLNIIKNYDFHIFNSKN